MQWLLRDGPRQFVLSTQRGAPFEGAVLVDDSTAAASILRTLAYDEDNLRALRKIHTDLISSHNARSRADTLILAELMGQVAARRLYLFEQNHTVSLTYDLPPEDEEQELLEDAEQLRAEPEPPPPEPAPSPLVLAQAAALKDAAQSGAPFCEE